MAKGLLEGKHGVVFGVANERSIAWACAKACVEAGATLTFNHMPGAQEKRVKKLLEELPGSGLIPCDVSSDTDISAFFNTLSQEHSKVDFIIHSVAYAEREDLQGKFLNTPRSNYNLALDISAYSLTAIAREAGPLLDNGGSIITMSYLGAERVVPHYNVMGVAKAALEAGARYLAADLGPKGIRVNCISAGPIKTLSSSAIPGLRQMLKASEQTAPLGRNVTQEDVAGAAVFLASELSSAITGEVLHVDGGYHAMGIFGRQDAGEGE